MIISSKGTASSNLRTSHLIFSQWPHPGNQVFNRLTFEGEGASINAKKKLRLFFDNESTLNPSSHMCVCPGTLKEGQAEEGTSCSNGGRK